MNGRHAVFVGIMLGVSLYPCGARAAEHGGAAMKEHGGAAMTTPSTSNGQPAQAQPAGTSTSVATSADADASVGATDAGMTAGADVDAGVTAEAMTDSQPQAEPAPEQLRQAIRDHITQIKDEEGAFTIEDEQTGNVRTLELVQVHERVGKTGSAYYSCTDMKDTESGEMLDLDFDVESVGDQLLVTDTRIHKVNGNARYTYDANDNRVPAASVNTNTSTNTATN